MLPMDTRASSLSFFSCRSGIRSAAQSSAVTQDFLESLSHAEERVVAAWTRIGLAEVDRHNKWTSFVEGRLLPFLQDYARMQVSEEVAIAAENDRLFREMFFASLRLRELPKSRELARLVETVMDQGVSHHTPTTGHQQQQGKSGACGWYTEPAESSSPRGEDVPSSHQMHLQLLLLEGEEGGELGGSFTLPSFVAVAAALSNEDASSFNAFLASRAHGEHQQHQQEEPRGTSLSAPFMDAVPVQSPAWAAVWQLARSMTHQELHRNLANEVQRMNSLADARLQQLCLLYKQRALLQLSPQEQTAIRAKYAERLLFRGHHKPASQQQQQLSSSCSACGHGTASSGGASVVTPGPSSGRTTTNSNSRGRSCNSIVKDEVDLLSESFPERLRVDVDCPSLLCPNQGELSGAMLQEELQVRETIFKVDLGDITRFGRRQDLSLARIDAETQDILAEIVAQNERMVFHANEELHCVEELWDLLETSAAAAAAAEEEEVGGDRVEQMGEVDGKREEDGELPSRHEFMCHLMQLRQEYEHPDAAEESAAAAAVASSTLEDELQIGKVATNNSNSGVTSHRTTCSSRSRAFSHPRVALMREGGGGGGGGGGTTAQLPAPLIKLLTARSYAPILAYIVAVRERLQRFVLQRHVEFAQVITEKLTEMHRRYFDKTRDLAYQLAPDYSQWLQENANVASARSEPLFRGGCTNVVGSETGLWQQFLTEFTPRNGNDSLRERISEVQQVVNRAKAELHLLHHRLNILEEVEPLLQRRQEILEQLQSIEEGSRDRLLSKKANMAKQLLFEEETRRRFARELPKIIEQMGELLRQWEDTASGGDGDGSSSRRLVVRGIDIADLIREFHDGAARLAAARRPPISLRRGGSNSSHSRSPPPMPPSSSSSQNIAGFATPQRAPLTTRVAKFPRCDASSTSPVPRVAVDTTTAAASIANKNDTTRAISPALSAPLTARLHSAKKSVSPAPVKRAALSTRRHGVTATAAAASLCKPSTTKKNSSVS